ncbi:class I SAM-dependent methyltransferase [Desulfovibrio sp.]
MAQDLRTIRTFYETVAVEWARAFAGEHDRKPMDHEMLARFARDVGDRRPVWEFGCGPGNTCRLLKNLGLEPSGLDLSEGMLEQARAAHPDIVFRAGNMLDLDFPDASLAGIVAFYAIVHFSPEQIARAFHEAFRVLRPGGPFLLAWHVGEGSLRITEFLGKAVDVAFILFPVDQITDLLRQAGFTRVEVVEREPYPDVEYPTRRAYGFAGA